MDFRLTREEEAFLKEITNFLDSELPEGWPGGALVTHEESVEEISQLGARIRRELAAKGWIGISWPEEYGGQGAPLAKQMMLEEQVFYQQVPGYNFYSMVMAGPLILQFGSEKQKKRFIPAITSGAETWAIGMSEPNAGSDLAALQLNATEKEDCFILNGQKTWTSGIHTADWCMVYARTDPDVPRHRGISCFLVKADSPGFTICPIADMGGFHTLNEVFFDNVRVPKENLLGEKNRGWNVTLASFASERTFGVMVINQSRRALEMLIEYCKETYVNGQPLAKDPVIRNKLAQAAIEIEVGYTLGHKLNWMATEGMPIINVGSQCRVHASMVALRLVNLGMQILGLNGQLDGQCKWAKIDGRMKNSYLWEMSVGIRGGSVETAKNTIATFGLGLPRG